MHATRTHTHTHHSHDWNKGSKMLFGYDGEGGWAEGGSKTEDDGEFEEAEGKWMA